VPVQIRTINKDRKFEMKGGIVLDGFPSTGLVNAIASECLIQSVETEFVAIVDSPEFPPLSIINDHVPQFPARLYVNEALKVGFFISELNISPYLQREVAKSILQWTIEQQCKMIISAVGVANSSSDTNNEHTDQRPSQVVAVASTDSARNMIGQLGCGQLTNGTVTGIPAILLNEGALTGVDVILLMVNTMTDSPDFGAAALIVDYVTKLVPGLNCDIGALKAEAEGVENKIKQIRDGQRDLNPYA